MIRNKWMWTGLLVCACIAAAVAVRPMATKLILNNPESTSIEQDLQKPAANATFGAGNAQLNPSSNGVTKKSIGTVRALTQVDRALLSPVPTLVTEADKQAAAEARALLPRQPHTPSLDQGSDNCTGVPDLGSALGVAVATGTTAGATNNRDTTGFAANPPTCWQGTLFSGSSVGPDVYYKWTAPASANFTFSLCAGSATGNTYDTGLTLWNFTCPAEPTYPANFICGNDDGGICINNLGSELTCVPLTSGQQILIVVDAYAGEAGDTYSLDITQCAPCPPPTCPGGWTAEGEPTCGDDYVDNTNGGANSDPCVFTNINCGATICAESGTYLVNGTDENRDTDWYRLILTDTTRVTWHAVGEFDLTSFLLVPGPVGFECVLDSVGVAGGPFDVAPCETLAVSGCLEPGEYWIFIGPRDFNGLACGSRYNFWVDCEPCVISDCFEATITVDCVNGTTFNGNTTGAGDDCYVSGTTQADTLSEDQIWEIIIPQNGIYSFSLCTGATSWDSYIFLATGCCSGTILNDFANDDDRCGISGGLSATECLTLTAGTYYLFVEGWQQTASGPYTVTVTCCTPCVVNCVDNEAEVDCIDGFEGTNDGCNMTVPSFEAITCGQTKCGTSGNYAINDTTNGRDLDWYVLTLTDTMRITAVATAEFNNNVWILSSNCAAPATLGFSQANACSTNSANACVPQGTYYVVVGPQLFTGTACGARYQLTVTCDPCVIPVSLTTCSPDAINSQPAHLSTEGWGLNGADSRWGATTSLKVFDNFTLNPGEVVGGVTFWGGHVNTANFNNCTSEETMTFEIAFWADSSNRRPDFSGGPLCRDTVTLTATFNGQVYLPAAQAIQGKIYNYEYPEGQCCSLATGVQHWISIMAVSLGSPDCRFMSLSSATGDLSINPFSGANNCRSLQYSNGTLAITGVDSVRHRAFCLTPCAIPCFDVVDLAVVLAPGNTNARLHFTAPQSSNYVIYSTTNPAADENPDNGADPNYVVEANVFLTMGAQTWNAPAGIANYKKFVVVANCN